MAELVQDAGVPAGVVNVLPTADSAPLVEATLGHRAVRMLSFTGSTATGQRLLRLAADRVLRW